MVIMQVSITHLICSFSVTKALIAQRYPSKLYAKLVVWLIVLKRQFLSIWSLIVDKQGIDTPVHMFHWI